MHFEADVRLHVALVGPGPVRMAGMGDTLPTGVQKPQGHSRSCDCRPARAIKADAFQLQQNTRGGFMVIWPVEYITWVQEALFCQAGETDIFLSL